MRTLDKRSRPFVIALCVLLTPLAWAWVWQISQPRPLYGERFNGRVQQLTYDYDHAVWLAHLDAHVYETPAAVVRIEESGPVVLYVAPAGSPILPPP